MATRSRLIWQKATSLSPSSLGRGFSTVTSNLLCCGLPYNHKEDWENVEDFMERVPLLRPTPKDRLINVKSDSSYMATEAGKRFMWSAVMIPFIAHCMNLSSAGVFSKGTVQVFKPLGVLAVKDFMGAALNEDLFRSDYAETKAYLMSLLQEQNGAEVARFLPRSMLRWFETMEFNSLDEEDICFNACLLPRESCAHLYLDIFVHVRKEMPLFGGRSGKKAADAILAAIPDESLHEDWPVNIDKNVFLRRWRTHHRGKIEEKAGEGEIKENEEGKRQRTMGEEKKDKGKMRTVVGEKKGYKIKEEKEDGKGQRTWKGEEKNDKGKMRTGAGEKKGEGKIWMGTGQEKGEGKKRKRRRKKKKEEAKGREKNRDAQAGIQLDRNVGQDVVDLHRHSYIHAYERGVAMLLKALSKDQLLSFSKDPYCVWDVIDLLHHEFPGYLQRCLEAIKVLSPEL